MPATVLEIVNAATAYCGEVAGPGVQSYSEDRFFAAVVRGFDRVFKKRFWDQYVKWYRVELDETLGIITTDAFEKVRDFEDFAGVYRDGSTVSIAKMPVGLNPYSRTFTNGTRIRYWTSLHVSDANYAKRRLQFYPVTGEGFVNVCAREYPLNVIAETWDNDDIMYFDKDLMMYAASYEMLAADDLNVNAATMAKGEMETKYKDIVSGLGNHVIAVRGNNTIYNQWHDQWSTG